MATSEQLERAREKALESPDIGKRGKGKKTLEAEEFRSMLMEMVSEYWEQLLEAQIKDALKSRQAREFLINQVIGKAEEKQKFEDEPMTIHDVFNLEKLGIKALGTDHEKGISLKKFIKDIASEVKDEPF